MNRFGVYFIIVFVSLLIALDTKNAKQRKTQLSNKITGRRTSSSTTSTVPSTVSGSTTEKSKFIRFNAVDNFNETAQQGSTAILECPILAGHSFSVNVTWKKNGVVLTENNKTKYEDKRFLATSKYENHTIYWLLRIRYTQDSDVGQYECEVKGEDGLKGNLFVNLNLQRAKAVIKDAEIKKRREVKVGAPLRLSCYLNNSIEAPYYIFWYKESRVINFDLTNGSSIREGHQGSELIFPSAQLSDTGNYSCVPSNADQASVYVIVTLP